MKHDFGRNHPPVFSALRYAEKHNIAVKSASSRELYLVFAIGGGHQQRLASENIKR